MCPKTQRNKFSVAITNRTPTALELSKTFKILNLGAFVKIELDLTIAVN